ncbi:MAG: deoxyribodipyrimidine photo-lyase, partial [Proteobacteria bacterium]|nr:deoxyribodipyrimidine photo-lyase [Pseudomonadota bacterium]
MSNPVNLIWVRNDLRLSDNPALYAAQGDKCFVLFTLDGLEGEHLGAASKVFLHHALAAFRDELYQKYKVQLLIRNSFKQAVDELKAVST